MQDDHRGSATANRRSHEVEATSRVHNGIGVINQERTSRLSVCDYMPAGSGSGRWAINDLPLGGAEYVMRDIPSDVNFRLLIYEGTLEQLRGPTSSATQSPLEISNSILSFHELDSIPAIGAKVNHEPNTFFAKWSRYTTQKSSNWEIERRILSERPYDTNTATDPHLLRLKHTTYARYPPTGRPYFPISITKATQY